jgi:FkbM family methyltransferase
MRALLRRETYTLDKYSGDQSPWGTHTPRGKRKLLRSLVALGFGHGPLKKYLGNIWLSDDAMTPVDISYGRGALRFKLRLHPRDSVTERKILFGSRTRDHEEVRWLRRYVQPGAMFLDIGANVGYYTLWAVVLGASKVVAVEPNPIAYRRLIFNVQINGFEDRVITENIALGSSAGEAVLSMPTGSIGGSTLRIVDDARERIRVPVLPLQSLVELRKITRIDMLKIDIEGMEDSVLLPFFGSVPSELWPRSVIIEHTCHREWKDDVLEFMLENGYRKEGRTRANTLLKKK